jgi:hypothetical protein
MGDAGRPAWVGVKNNPKYRGKRLQNHVMDALHERSKQDGTLVQVINGINWVCEILHSKSAIWLDDSRCEQ